MKMIPLFKRSKSSKGKAHLLVRPWRAGLSFALLIILSGICIWRLSDLQLSQDEKLLNEVGSHLQEETIEAVRGNIYDRQGHPLALSIPRPTIAADPRRIARADTTLTVEEIAQSLANIIGEETAAELAVSLNLNSQYVRLARQVEPHVAEAVMALKIPGIWLEEEQARVHPNGKCSALEVVGTVTKDHEGVGGLEEQYEERLRGTAGRALRQKQISGAVQMPGGYQIIEPHTPGENITLSIDRNIQHKAEQILESTLETAEAELAMAIVSNPRNGEIYAMASATRNIDTGVVSCATHNRSAIWAYEPGSAMKAVTLAGVLDHGVWRADQAVEVPATIEIQREVGVENHIYKDLSIPWGETTQDLPASILARSSNTGTVYLAQELGAEKLQDTFERFGFGTRTALGFPWESNGILGDLGENSLSLPNAAIGQGIAVTPLQLIQAYNTIANGGVRADPTLLSVADSDASVNSGTRIVSSKTAQAMMEMMRGVVSSGTGKRAAIPGYLVAGKTGTAWQPCGHVAGYDCDPGEEEIERHYTATFVGIVENDQGPVLSAIVVVDNPKGSSYGGGSVAAPAFAELATYGLRQLHLAPFGENRLASQRIRTTPAEKETATDE